MYLLKIWIDYGFDGERTINIQCSESKEKLSEQIEIIKQSIKDYRTELTEKGNALKIELNMFNQPYSLISFEQKNEFAAKFDLIEKELSKEKFGEHLSEILSTISISDLNDSKFIIEKLHLLV